jgi:hypothetical protein
MNRTDANGTGDHRRRVLISTRVQHHSIRPDPIWTGPRLAGEDDIRSFDMYGLIHEQLARQRHREAYLEARRARLVRAVRARERARRAADVAARAIERAAAEPHDLAVTA